MYGIALSVSACLRGGTRVDVAWNLDPHLTPQFDPTDAVAITPGGGRLGALLDGALDSHLIELAAAKPTEGRILAVAVNPLEAELLGLAPGTTLRLGVAPADTLPAELWDILLDRRPVTLAATVVDGRITEPAIDVDPTSPTSEAVVLDDNRLITSLRPTPTLVIMGGGPMADALARAAAFVGWKVEANPGTEGAVALATSLSPLDGIVVMGHDTEATGRVLQTALGSGAGYIGSIGPHALQEARGDWLAYRGVTDTSRIHGPAGVDIGASSPEQVAISVVAEMIAAQNGITL